MKAIVIAALLALSFTTGFTCSKNEPNEQPAPEVTTEESAPAEGQPVEGDMGTESDMGTGTETESDTTEEVN